LVFGIGFLNPGFDGCAAIFVFLIGDNGVIGKRSGESINVVEVCSLEICGDGRRKLCIQDAP
jgi:hypothetical protein